MSVCLAIFLGVLKYRLITKEIKDEIELQPLQYSDISILRKENRGRLALRLDEGGRDEANNVYQQIKQDPSQKTWKIKVLTLMQLYHSRPHFWLEFLRNMKMYEDVMQQKYKTSCKICIRMLRLIRIDEKKESSNINGSAL